MWPYIWMQKKLPVPVLYLATESSLSSVDAFANTLSTVSVTQKKHVKEQTITRRKRNKLRRCGPYRKKL